MSLDKELREIGIRTSEARRLEEEGKIAEAVELLIQLSQELRALADRATTSSLRGVLMQRSLEYANNATQLKRQFLSSQGREEALTDQEGIAEVQVLRGQKVAAQLLKMLQSAQYRILIATHQIHAVELIDPEDQKPAINLLTLLKEIHEAGVKIRILTTPPAQIPGVDRWKHADALRSLANEGIEFRLCSHLHFNGVLVDDYGVWRGTAPLTENALTGLDDVVEFSTAQWLIAVYLDLFRARWEQSDLTCSQCFEKTCLSKYKAEDPRRSYEETE
ncbi:MAG: phospholipase D-like domain-containing protein [Candidatus Thorarchaeota archaeon]